MKTTIGNYASYVYIKEWKDSFKPLRTESVGNFVNLDYSHDGVLVGIEILGELVPEYYSDYVKKDKE